MSDQFRRRTDEVSRQSLRAPQAEIPQDLLVEILICSPVKSLLRFRCVSKPFCTLIDGKDFTFLHHNRSLENKTRRKMIVRDNLVEKRDARLHVIDVDSGLEEKIKKPFKKSPKPYGYCDGLILLFITSLKLALWNPSTQKYRNLPTCPAKVMTGKLCSTIGMGLGYDVTHDEYKVVLIENVKTNRYSHDRQVWIFGLRSNSWKKIQTFPCEKRQKILFGYFANGCLYWLYQPSRFDFILVTFDVAKETISSRILSSRTFRSWQRIGLHVLDGCLYMSYFCWHEDQTIFHVQKKEGSEDIWSELFSVNCEMLPRPLLFPILKVRVLGYTKEEDKIMLDLGGFKCIVLYDLKDKSFSKTKDRSLVDDDPTRLCIYPFLCHESLVSVGDVNSCRKSGQKRRNRTENSLQQQVKIANAN